MATLNLGRIKPVFRGAYSGSTAYVVDDIVTSGGSSYICIQAHGAGTQAVTVTAYWSVLASTGTDVGSTITTQGDILYRDGSGLQRLAKGTAAQTLKMNSGATAPEWATVAAASTDFVKLASGAIPSDASVLTIDNIFTSGTYYIYKVYLTNVDFQGGNAPMALRFVKNSDGGQYTTAKYCEVLDQNYRSSGTTSASVGGMWEQDRFKFSSWDSTDNDDTNKKNTWEFTFFDPMSNFGQNMHYHACQWEQANNYFLQFTGVGTMRHDTVPMRGLRFYNTGSHNFTAGGYYCVYGLKH